MLLQDERKGYRIFGGGGQQNEGRSDGDEIARGIDSDPEDAFHVLHHLASNDPRIRVAAGNEPVDDRFSLGESK